MSKLSGWLEMQLIRMSRWIWGPKLSGSWLLYDTRPWLPPTPPTHFIERVTRFSTGRLYFSNLLRSSYIYQIGGATEWNVWPDSDHEWFKNSNTLVVGISAKDIFGRLTWKKTLTWPFCLSHNLSMNALDVIYYGLFQIQGMCWDFRLIQSISFDISTTVGRPSKLLKSTDWLVGVNVSW